ncbi:hypothetical protein ASF27_12565 [Methylobacterium sp. Leaf102]|nr:hypothetical protein ASF27_12565 [Methylobacterium sp. Leaf102]
MKTSGNAKLAGTPILAPDFDTSFTVHGTSVPSRNRIVAIQFVSLRTSRRANSVALSALAVTRIVLR